MKRIATIALLLAGAALLAGCPKKPTIVEPPTAGSQVGGSSTSGSANGASTNGSPLGGDADASSRGGVGADGSGPNSRKIIYFDFDKSEIKPEFASIVTSAAQKRGTREYNIGLGERRAQAVRRALLLQGAAETQISTVSFGAERPAAEGDDEAAWAQNRRVELVYLP
jgi:peptidoglycan-associated lipoprotein